MTRQELIDVGVVAFMAETPAPEERFKVHVRVSAALNAMLNGIPKPDADRVERAARALWEAERKTYTNRVSWEQLGDDTRAWIRANMAEALLAIDPVPA